MARTTGVPFWVKITFGATILVLFSGGVRFFRIQQRQQREEVESRLMTVAELKADQIAKWRKERLADAAFVLQRDGVISLVQEFLTTGSQQAASKLLRYFRNFRDRYDYMDVLLADATKKVRLSLSGKTNFHKGFSSTFDLALRSGKPEWTAFHVDPELSRPHLSVVTPLFTRNENPVPVGAVILVNDATRFLYPLIQRWPTPSKTAETLLVRKDGDDILFLNELRHRKHTALQLRIALSRRNLPAAMAAEGKRGVVYGKDYRGVDVVAAVLPVPDSPWYMVAKMDSSEAFAHWRFRSVLILFLLLGAMALAGVAVLLIWQQNRKAHYKLLYQSEAALRAAAEKQAVILKSIGDAVIATDQNGRVEIMNPVAEALTGWREKEAQGKALQEVFHIINEKTRKPAENPVERVLSEGKVMGLANSTLLIKRDGGEIPIADSGAPVFDGQGNIMGVVLVFRDQSEERLAKQLTETRLSLIEYANTHTLGELLTRTLDEVGALVDSPLGFYHFVEDDQETLSLQQWSTSTLKEFCAAEGNGMRYKLADAGVWVDCVYQKKPVVHNDYASLSHKKGLPKGHARVIRELVVPVMRGNKVVSILGVGNKPVEYNNKDVEIVSYLADEAWEIVKRKRADDALRVSLERYEKTFQTVPVWVVLRALEDGRYVEVNEAFLKATGYRREEVIGKTSLEVHTWVDPQQLESIMTQIREKGGIRDFQVKRRTRSGEILETLFSAETIVLEGIPVMISVTQDITGQKKAEAESKALQNQLIQAQKMESVGRLAGGVAHDFNNMLGVILGRTELMLMDMEPDTPFYGEVTEIQNVAKRSAEMARQLLAFARKQTISPTVLDLNETVEGMLKMLRRLIGEDINLAWKPDGDLWLVKMDPAQIDQILANLCVNARDAIAGTGKVTIETENVALDEDYCAEHAGFHPGEYVMLGVSDDGCGMDAETTAKIFEPFFTTKKTGKGTGLGLATVYGIVKQNRGFVNVYSEPENGSTFKIYIPRSDAKDTTESQTKRETIPKAKGETILLVEDDPGIRTMTRKMLEKLGYQVLTGDTPGDALKQVEEQKNTLHLLMTDVVMPDMNGRELAEQVKEKKPGIKVLFMSGYTANVIAHQGVLDEGVHFIQKPFSFYSLAVTVRKSIDDETGPSVH